MAKKQESYELMTVFSLKNGEDAAKELVEKFREKIASAATLDKLVWVVAYYIEVYRRKVEAEPESLEKKQKLHDILDLEKDFERIFGCKALYVLNLAKDGIDLRQIVKE